MKVRWTKDEDTPDSLSQKLGMKVKSITRGLLQVGEEAAVADGMEVIVPILKEGIEIEFESEPTTEQLAKLDRVFSRGSRDRFCNRSNFLLRRPSSSIVISSFKNRTKSHPSRSASSATSRYCSKMVGSFMAFNSMSKERSPL